MQKLRNHLPVRNYFLLKTSKLLKSCSYTRSGSRTLKFIIRVGQLHHQLSQHERTEQRFNNFAGANIHLRQLRLLSFSAHLNSHHSDLSGM